MKRIPEASCPEGQTAAGDPKRLSFVHTSYRQKADKKPRRGKSSSRLFLCAAFYYPIS